jgi:transposase
MKITTVGIDLAKSVFQIHGVDERGKAVLRKQLKRNEVLKFFANLPPCLIGMEACGSAHHWARKLIELGHEVKLMSPEFVKPYVKTNKSDRNDAEGICEAVTRPNMRFVPVKTSDQQAVLAVHRARSGFVKARTAQANQIRGLLSEFGIVLPQGIACLSRRLPEILEDAVNGLPNVVRQLINGLLAHLKELDRQAAELERQIRLWHREHASSRKLERIPGIGPITASAYVASIGNANSFHNGRQVSAWVGLVPRQDSSGGKPRLLGISKHGDVYLRTLLIHGARAVLRHIEHRPDQADSWLMRLMARRGKNVAAVALANKNARIAWALLAHQRDFQANYTPAAPNRSAAECI